MYVAFGHHVVAMDRATGARVWTRDLVSPHSIRLSVHGDRLFALGSELVRLDAADGRVRWRAEQPGGATLLVDGDRVFTGGAGEVRCFDAETGALLWHDKFKGMGLGGVAIAVDGAAAQDDMSG